MNLWLCVLFIVYMYGDNGIVDGAIDYSDDPEMEAMQFVFEPDDAKHTGPERLKWHMDHLKWTTMFLEILNHVKEVYENRTFLVRIKSIEETWKMYDMVRGLNQIGQDTGLKYDIFEGDSFVIDNIAWYIKKADLTNWVAKHFQDWGPDFLKYVVQRDDFDYNITDPEKFVDAFYELGDDPVAFAKEIGMTMQQLRMFDEALEKAMLPRSEYWDQPMLGMEIAMQMCKLGLLKDCSGPRASVFDESTK